MSWSAMQIGDRVEAAAQLAERGDPRGGREVVVGRVVVGERARIVGSTAAEAT